MTLRWNVFYDIINSKAPISISRKIESEGDLSRCLPHVPIHTYHVSV